MEHKSTIKNILKDPFTLDIFALIIFFGLFWLFPDKSNNPTIWILQSITKTFFVFFLCPWLYVRFILKKKFRDFGFNLKNPRAGIILGGLYLVFMLILFYTLSRFTDFSKFYTLNPLAKISFATFLFYELILVAFPAFFQEYFFKGFLISVLKKNFSWGTILIQSSIYLILFMLSQDISSFWIFLPTILISFLGGIIAYLTKTFVYSYIASILFTIILDAYFIALL